MKKILSSLTVLAMMLGMASVSFAKSKPVISSIQGSGQTITVKWQKVCHATSYQVHYASHKSFKNEKVKQTKKTSTSIKASGTTYVRVRAYVNKKWQAYSSTRTIRIKKSQAKILVAYCSGSGNTARVAKEIAKTLNADTFVITPKNTYSEADLDWTNDNSRVNKEHNSTKLQNSVTLQSTKPAHFSSYKTVFIGYPIWWGNASWIINGFVRNNSFAKKTVIPFCTSSATGISQSVTNLKKMNSTGNWQSGHRFSEDASLKNVRSFARKVIAS